MALKKTSLKQSTQRILRSSSNLKTHHGFSKKPLMIGSYPEPGTMTGAKRKPLAKMLRSMPKKERRNVYMKATHV